MKDFYVYKQFMNRFDSNLFIRQFGHQKCLPSHSFGPATRDHYLIHFITSGKGRYHFGGSVYEVSANQCFLICPNDVTYYEADKDDPWTYLWLGFSGARALPYLEQISLTRSNPVLSINDMDYVTTCLEDMIESSKVIRGGEIRMLGHLYLLLSKLLEESKRPDTHSIQDDYIHKAIEYIEMNYARQVTIQDIAMHLSLNRSYFSNLFRVKLQKSPQQYLISHRINKACALLIQNKDLPISHIATSVGYPDQLTFSKTFRKVTGLSPSSFRARDVLKNDSR